MTSTKPKFGALVIASISGVVGAKYLIGGALALMIDSVVSSVLVAGTVSLTIGCGVMLCVVAGAFADGSTWARPMTIVAYALVIGLSIPAMRAMDPVIITETMGMGLSFLYLVVRNPIERMEATNVDDSDSATRYGSTLR